MKALISFCIICLPLKHLNINSSYGLRLHPVTGKYAMHAGVDLKARHDTVFAILSGRVSTVTYDDRLGISILIIHANTLESVYGHLSRVLTGPKDSVTAGDPIAITGATGRVTGEHLHFEIRYRHHSINPVKFLYELLIKNKNEQNFQSASNPAFR